MDQTAYNHHTSGRINPTSDSHSTVTPLVDRLSANLLDPIMLTESEYGNWIKRHACWCGSRLLVRFGPGRTWVPRCPEHGDIREGQYVTVSQAQRADQGMRNGLLEMRGK